MTFSELYHYNRLGESFDGEKTNANLECHTCRRNKKAACPFNISIILPWTLAVVFGVLSVVLWIRWPTQSRLGSYELGFTTDFRDFGYGNQVPLERVQFTGNLFFPGNETLKESLHQPNGDVAEPKILRYAGPPSQEIDGNWEKLLNNRYFSISEEEARIAWGDKFSQYSDKALGGYTAGLDLFHNLHCLPSVPLAKNHMQNYLRQGFFPEYYPVRPTFEIHRDHCIDILRQGIQCSGSTTLMPTMYMNGLHRNTIDSDQVHTCRSFDFIRDWTTQRGVGGALYVEREKS